MSCELGVDLAVRHYGQVLDDQIESEVVHHVGSPLGFLGSVTAGRRAVQRLTTKGGCRDGDLAPGL